MHDGRAESAFAEYLIDSWIKGLEKTNSSIEKLK
jgi:hypothetical protein